MHVCCDDVIRAGGTTRERFDLRGLVRRRAARSENRTDGVRIRVCRDIVETVDIYGDRVRDVDVERFLAADSRRRDRRCGAAQKSRYGISVPWSRLVVD